MDKLTPIHLVVLTSNGTYSEVAKELGIPIGTLKSRVNRARKALAKIRENASLTHLTIL